MGRARGGVSAKIPTVATQKAPVRLLPAAGQAEDAPSAPGPIDELELGSSVIDDRAWTRTRSVTDAISCSAWANFSPRVIGKGTFAVRCFVYRWRNLVDRIFNRIKHFRGIATRYDRRPDAFQATITLAAIRICLKRV